MEDFKGIKFYVERRTKRMTEMLLRLPWPPSVNSLWATTKKGNWYSTKVATDFKETVLYLMQQVDKPSFKDDDRLAVTFYAYPPDNRRRDLDNLFKVTADALQDAKVFKNDFQIKRIYMEMMEKDIEAKGYVLIEVSVMES